MGEGGVKCKKERKGDKEEKKEKKTSIKTESVCFLISSTTTILYRGRVSRLTSDNFTCCHMGSERSRHYARKKRRWELVAATL